MAAAAKALLRGLRAAGVEALGAWESPEAAREVARRSRDFFWYRCAGVVRTERSCARCPSCVRH